MLLFLITPDRIEPLPYAVCRAPYAEFIPFSSQAALTRPIYIS